jgi:broad-specificity NMP kinase
VLAEILDVCLIESLNRYGKEKVCEIDTSRRSLDENLKFAMEVLNYKIRPVSGQIDWITMLESENKLKEYIEW